jgi:hypothetical protein
MAQTIAGPHVDGGVVTMTEFANGGSYMMGSFTVILMGTDDKPRAFMAGGVDTMSYLPTVCWCAEGLDVFV